MAYFYYVLCLELAKEMDIIMKRDFERLFNMFFLIKKYWLSYGIATFGVASRNLFINLLNALLYSSIITIIQNYSNILLFKSISKFVFILIIFLISDSIFQFLQSITLKNITDYIRNKMFKSILYGKIENINKIGKHSELLFRINSDVDIAANIYGNDIIQPLLYLISGVGAIIVLIKVNYFLIFWALILSFIFLSINIFMGKIFRRIFILNQKNNSTLLMQFSEIFSNGFAIKSLNISNYLYNGFRIGLHKYDTINKQSAKVEATVTVFDTIQSILKYTGTILLCIYLFSQNILKLNEIILSTQMVGLIITMITSIGSSYLRLQQSLAGAERIFDVINLPTENYEVKIADIEFGCKDAIVFENLNVSYTKDNYVLTDFNSSIENNKLTILSGCSGKGKSTLLKVIMGFCTYDEGNVKLWNIDLKKYSVKDLRNLISYIPQNNLIFEGSIKYNIALGTTDSTMEEIENAARMACIHDFIINLPDGYETQIFSQNVTLSGGQKQCIAIARGILQDRPLLLFDEAFSAMGSGLATQIINNINNINNKTIVIVSHDTNILKLGKEICL